LNQRPSKAAAWVVALVLAGVSASVSADVARDSSALDGVAVRINDPAAAGVDFSALLDPVATDVPSDPQPLSFTGRGAEAPESGPPRRLAAAWAVSRPAELTDSPMAPLPPAIVAGPIGIAFATVIAWRAKRRGGRI
jgi:hypothetical protein